MSSSDGDSRKRTQSILRNLLTKFRTTDVQAFAEDEQGELHAATQNGARVDDTLIIVTGTDELGPLRLVREAIQRNQYQAAGEMLADVVRQDSENAEAWYLYGWLAAKIGRFDKSRTYLKRANKLGHDRAATALQKLERQISRNTDAQKITSPP